MNQTTLPVFTLALASTALTLMAAEPAVALRQESAGAPTEWTVFQGPQKVMTYVFSQHPFKPYVKELATPKGWNVIRDGPLDHLHHHALMYAIKVNATNFWEETPGCGVQKNIRVLRQEAGVDAQGRPQAVFSHLIHWVAPQNAFQPDTTATALLYETRTLTLTVDTAADETALDWRSEFTVGSGTPEAVLTGANYHGMGVRFQPELDALARHLVGGRAVDLSNNRQDLSAAPWGAVTFDLAGRQATFALFNDPANARGNAVYFSMATPFAYLSATQGLDKEPLTYRSGQGFTLHYLVTLNSTVKTAADLERRQQAWTTAKP